MLQEHGFDHVPQQVQRELQDFANAPKSTVLIENFGNLGRRIERKNGSGKCDPLTIWHRMLHTPLLKEFEAHVVPTTEAATAAAPAVVDHSLFETDAEECSITESQFDSLAEKNPSWPAQGPLNRRLAPLKAICAVECEGDWDQIQHCFWSRSMPTRMVCKQRGSRIGYLCMVADTFGCIGWKVHLKKRGELFLLNFGRKGEASQDFFVRDPTEWSCVRTMVVSPGDPEHDPDRRLAGLTVCCTTGMESMLAVQAKLGFHGHTREELRRIWAGRNIPAPPGRRPSTKGDFLAAIIRHELPGASDEEVAAAAEKHEDDPMDTLPVSDLIFDQDAMELVFEDMQDDDMLEIIQENKERFEKNKQDSVWQKLP